MKLALVRHAKSDWGDSSLDDHDRPLNDRGLRDAPAMARRLRESGFVLDGIIASTALRARTTAGFFGAEFGVEVRLDENLYGAPAHVLLRTAAESGFDAVMIVAHDPGMSALAGALSEYGISHMPTCAVAVFEWDGLDATQWDVATSVDPDRWTFDAPR